MPHARLLRCRGARQDAGRAPGQQTQSRRDPVDASESRNLAPDPAQGGGKSRGLSDKLRWRLNRLRCMTPLEIAHRTLRAMQARAESSGLLRAPAVPAPNLAIQAKPWVRADGRIDAAPYVAAANRAADGRLDIFTRKDADIGMPPRWNRDPKTGIEAPLAFGKLLDYRDQDLVGDIKYLWEPNRHLHIVTMAQAYALTKDRRHYDALVQHLDSWFIACPYGKGPNWASALEMGIRLVNWAIAWQLVAPVLDEEFRQRWLTSVYQHAHAIRGWFSAHSSANNHL